MLLVFKIILFSSHYRLNSLQDVKQGDMERIAQTHVITAKIKTIVI